MGNDHTFIGMHIANAFEGKFVCFRQLQWLARPEHKQLKSVCVCWIARLCLHSIVCLVVAILFSTISGPVCTSLHRAANFRPKAVKLRNPCVIFAAEHAEAVYYTDR